MAQRILLVNDTDGDIASGVTNFVSGLIEQLPKLGTEAHVISARDFRRLPFSMYGGKLRLGLPSPGRIRNALKTFDPDAIHIVREGPVGLAVQAFLLATGRQFTTSYRTHLDHFLSARVHAAFRTPTQKLVERHLISFHNRSRRVMVTASHIANDLVRKGLRTPTHLVPQAIDVDSFTPGKATLFLDRHGPISLYVGRVTEEKNIEAFLDMKIPGTKVVVGDGPYLNHLMRVYGSNPDIIFTGEKRGQELVEHYRSSDVFVFPSKFDTYGVVLLEAISTGLPVVAYPLAAAPALTKDERFGSCHSDLGQAYSNVYGRLHTDTAETVSERHKAMRIYNRRNTARAFLDGQVPVFG